MAAETPDERRARVLERELADRGAGALLVVAAGAEDHDLAPFVGPVHLGRSFVVLRPDDADAADAAAGGGSFLGYLTAMERDEARRTGLDLLTPAELDVDTLVRQHLSPGDLWAAVLETGLGLAGVPPGRVALAGHLGSGVTAGFVRKLDAAGYHLFDGTEVARLLRKTKTEADLAGIRAAASGTRAAFEAVARLLATADVEPSGELRQDGAPLTVGRLRAAISRVFSDHDLTQPHGNIVAPAEEGAVPHTSGTNDRVLRASESLVVDLYPKGALWADCTRTFCVGPVPEPLERAHRATLDALAAAHAATRPGVRGWDLQLATCRHFEGLGYPTLESHPATEVGYVHGLLHGVGFELHEAPVYRKESGAEGLVEAGDVVTLEPGLYSEEERYGVRLEDLVVVGEEGDDNENLTPLPYGLDPAGWFDGEGRPAPSPRNQ